MTTITVYDTDGAIIEWARVAPEYVAWQLDAYRATYGFPADAMTHEGMVIATGATTCTVQQHGTSGDVHALRYQGTTITGISDALPHRDVHALTPADLPLLTYGPYPGKPDGTGPDGAVQWLPPIITSEERS